LAAAPFVFYFHLLHSGRPSFPTRRSSDLIEVPNPGVDVNSWPGSACYPRRTFYPLSDGPSIQNHRITKSWFPTCSTCWSRSQALLCLYTRRLISKQPERSFERLRYRLGGDRPSQTTRLAMSLLWIHRSRLEPRNDQGDISLLPPLSTEAQFQSLPTVMSSHHNTSLP